MKAKISKAINGVKTPEIMPNVKITREFINTIENPGDIVEIIREKFKKEVFLVFLLNKGFEIKGYYYSYTNPVTNDIKKIIRSAKDQKAFAIIAVDVDPEKDAMFLAEEKAFYKKLQSESKKNNIIMIDAIAVGKTRHKSLASEMGLMGIESIDFGNISEINKENYFEAVKKFKRSDLPSELQEIYDFIEAATENHKNWDQVTPDDEKDILDIYFKSMTKLIKDKFHKETKVEKKKTKPVDKKIEEKEHKPKFKVGGYVNYTTGDTNMEYWVGVITEIVDLKDEFAYRINAYNYDGSMFDSDKTNEVFEVRLRPASKRLYDKAKKKYEDKKAKTTPKIEKQDLKVKPEKKEIPDPIFKKGEHVLYKNKDVKIIEVNQYDSILKDWIYTVIGKGWNDADNVGESSLKIKVPKKDLPTKKHKETETNYEIVKKTPVEINIMRYFLSFNKKYKTKGAFSSFIKRIKKLKAEEGFKKFGNKIESLLSTLVKTLKSMEENKHTQANITLTDSMAKDLQFISEQYKTDPAIRLLNLYLNLVRDPSIEKAQKLDKMMQNALGKTISKHNVLYEDIIRAKKKVHHYIGTGQKPQFSEKGLTGPDSEFALEGCGIKKKSTKKTTGTPLNGIDELESRNIINSTELENVEYELAGVTGKYKDLLGDVSFPFNMLIWGPGGAGKSTLAIILSKYFGDELDSKILYISGEEGIKHTFKDKLKRMGAFHPNIDIAKEIPEDFSPWDIIVADSAQQLNLTPDKLDKIQGIWNEKGKSFWYVMYGLKNGDSFKGASDYLHLCDIQLGIDNSGVAQCGKNRFGGNKPMRVFDKADMIVFSKPDLAERYIANRKNQDLKVMQSPNGKYIATTKANAELLKDEGYLEPEKKEEKNLVPVLQ